MLTLLSGLRRAGKALAMVFDHGRNTFMGKTASMISSVDEVGHFQMILMQITGFLMGVSFVLVGIALALLLARDNPLLDSIAFCVVLLVASIPIAMPVVSTSTMALGSRALSEEGAIVTRLASIEEVAGMDMLCSDKTGTLTKNVMIIREDRPCFRKEDLERKNDLRSPIRLLKIALRVLDSCRLMADRGSFQSTARTRPTTRSCCTPCSPRTTATPRRTRLTRSA